MGSPQITLEELRPELEMGIPTGRYAIDFLAVEAVAEVKSDHTQHRRLHAKAETQAPPQLQRVEVGDRLPGVACMGVRWYPSWSVANCCQGLLDFVDLPLE